MFNMNPSTYYFWATIGSFAYGAYSAARYYSVSGVDLITSKEAKKKIKNGEIKYVIDVRTKLEWDAGHYKGAKHIPIQEINQKTTSTLKKNAGIVTYCNTGQRARAGAERLKALGFKNVYYIDGTYSQLN